MSKKTSTDISVEKIYMNMCTKMAEVITQELKKRGLKIAAPKRRKSPIDINVPIDEIEFSLCTLRKYNAFLLSSENDPKDGLPIAVGVKVAFFSNLYEASRITFKTLIEYDAADGVQLKLPIESLDKLGNT